MAVGHDTTRYCTASMAMALHLLLVDHHVSNDSGSLCRFSAVALTADFMAAPGFMVATSTTLTFSEHLTEHGIGS